jgi:hypothetical protein
MTTVNEAPVADKNLSLPWDYFLRDYVHQSDSRRKGKSLDVAVESVRSHIDRFRETEWKSIRRDLARQYHWEVPEGLEPHWTGPKNAVFWAHQVISQRDLDEQNHPVMVEKDYGWVPTSPMPANNASHIAHYFQKGFRMRPPENGVDAKYVEAAAPEDVVQGVPENDKPTYECKRHVTGPMTFRSWKAYLNHLDYYQEIPECEPPDEVKEKMGKFRWYCVLHNRGFNVQSMAERHIRQERGRAGSRPHVGIRDMQIKKKSPSG